LKPKDGSDIFLWNCEALYEDGFIISGTCAASCAAVVIERCNGK
jgi:hypothetical protein